MDDIKKLIATSMAEEFNEFTKDILPKEAQVYMENELPKIMQETMKFRSSLTEETDRGCALISASFLDKQLEELIKSYLVNDTNIVNNIFSSNGALGTFSSRIDMAYLLGLIGKKARRDLHIIRKIRNEFGHNPEPISFDTQSIQNRCVELYYYNLTNYDNDSISSRKRFIKSVCGILGRMKGKMIDINHIDLESDANFSKEKQKFNSELGLLIVTNSLKKVLDTIND